MITAIRVREQVVSSIGDNLDELLPDDVAQLAADETDDRVRFRLALDLSGRSPDAMSERRALIRLLDRGVDDPWLRIAVGTMKSDPPEALLNDILDHWASLKKIPAGGPKLIEQLSEIAGAQLDPKAVKPILGKLLQFEGLEKDETLIDLSAAGIRGFGLGAARRGVSFTPFRDELSPPERDRLNGLVSRLLHVASDSGITPQRRFAAIRTLPFGEEDQVVLPLLDLALSGTEIPVKLAALDVLASLNDPRIAPKVMASFDAQTPQLRRDSRCHAF